MKVEFLEVMGGKDVIYEVGKVYDLKDAIAKRYVDHGICKLVEEKKVVRKKKTKK